LKIQAWPMSWVRIINNMLPDGPDDLSVSRRLALKGYDIK